MTVVEAPPPLNDEQLQAVEATGSVFVSAGAGTGKTSVLVERYVRAVCDRGIDVESILVITYTRKAAGELRSRIRSALRTRGRPDLARELDGAWISTIHGFCSRLLRTYPFAVGLDPRFRELEDSGAAVLRGEAFERALESFCSGGDPERLRLLATYRANGLRRMLTGVYETLRSAGRELVLELGERPGLADAVERLSEEAVARRRRVGDRYPTANCERGAPSVTEGSPPERLVDLSAFQCRGARRLPSSMPQGCGACRPRGARRVRSRSAAGAPRALCRGVRGRETSGVRVDFEDLQLAARDLLRDRRHSRGHAAAFPARDGRRVPGHEPAAVRAHRPPRPSRADRRLHGRGRVPVDLRIPARGCRRLPRPAWEASNLLALRSNYRSRPQVLAAVNFLFGGAFGDEYQPLAASAEFADPVFGHPVELLVTDKASYRDTEEHWRTGRLGRLRRACASSSTPARRPRARSSCSSQPGPTPSATRKPYDRRVSRRIARPGGATSASSRSSTSSRTCASFTTATTTSRSRPSSHRRSSASRTTRSSCIRRNAPAGPSSPRWSEDRRRNSPPRTSGCCARSSSATSGSSRHRRASGSSALRADPGRARLRPGGARALGRLPPVREPPKARAGSRANTRRSAAPTLRLHPFRSRAGGARGEGARGGCGGGRCGRGAPPHDPWRQGSRVQGRHRRRRRPRRWRASRRRRDRRSLGRPLRLPHGAPDAGERRPVFDFEEVLEAEREQERAERLRLYYVAMTRAIDRLIVSGAIDHERAADRETPSAGCSTAWTRARSSDPRVKIRPSSSGRDARFLLRVHRSTGPANQGASSSVRCRKSRKDSSRSSTSCLSAPRLSARAALRSSPRPYAAVHDVRRLSYSALALFERCSYRYFAERVLGSASVAAAWQQR